MSQILSSSFLRLADSSLHSFQFNVDDTFNLINNQDYNKVHGHNIISICRLKICGISITLDIISKTSDIIFNACLEREFSRHAGRKQKSFQFTREGIAKAYLITCQFLFLATLLKDLYTMQCSGIFQVMNRFFK